MKNPFNTIYIYVPDTKQMIRITEGTGDNLLDEDMDAGYVDYIYYEQYEFKDIVDEVDGGMVMLTELFREKYKSTEECVPYVLDMAYDISDMKYILLG